MIVVIVVTDPTHLCSTLDRHSSLINTDGCNVAVDLRTTIDVLQTLSSLLSHQLLHMEGSGCQTNWEKVVRPRTRSHAILLSGTSQTSGYEAIQYTSKRWHSTCQGSYQKRDTPSRVAAFCVAQWLTCIMLATAAQSRRI